MKDCWNVYDVVDNFHGGSVYRMDTSMGYSERGAVEIRLITQFLCTNRVQDRTECTFPLVNYVLAGSCVHVRSHVLLQVYQTQTALYLVSEQEMIEIGQ